MNKVILYSIFLIFSVSVVKGQIGINNINPDSSSILDMTGGQNLNKGIILPITTSKLLINKPAHGLLIFNESDQEFYFKNDSSNAWESLNRLKSNEGKTSYILDSLGIGKSDPVEQIDVQGNMRLSGTINRVNSLGNINTLGKIQENGHDLIPQGTIVMWSGKLIDIPESWVLCDGKQHMSSNGSGLISTPDLRGRFIVGITNTDINDYDYTNTEKNRTAYDLPGKTGGAYSVLIRDDQSGIPAHKHHIDISTTTTDDGKHTHRVQTHDGGGSTATIRGNTGLDNSTYVTSRISGGDHVHDVTVTGYSDDAGGYDAINSHENRPPYYTLAFIMKL